jgi:antitoxin HicB
MKVEHMKTAEHYRDLPYKIVLRKDDDGDWIARVEELPGCTAHGATKAEAIESLEEVQSLWIEDAIAAGDPIPEPVAEEALSGKWLQRVPRSLHRRVSELAKNEGVSLNQLVTSVLAEAVGRRLEPVRSIGLPHTAELLWSLWPADPTPLSTKGEWNLPEWKHGLPLDLAEAIAQTVSALPNCMSEDDFRVIERAQKKQLSAKAS